MAPATPEHNNAVCKLVRGESKELPASDLVMVNIFKAGSGTFRRQTAAKIAILPRKEGSNYGVIVKCLGGFYPFGCFRTRFGPGQEGLGYAAFVAGTIMLPRINNALHHPVA